MIVTCENRGEKIPIRRQMPLRKISNSAVWVFLRIGSAEGPRLAESRRGFVKNR